MNLTSDLQNRIESLSGELEKIREFLRALPVDLKLEDLIKIAEEEGCELRRGRRHALNPQTARNIVKQLLQLRQDRLLKELGELCYQASRIGVDGGSSDKNFISVWQKLAIAQGQVKKLEEQVKKLESECETAFSLAEEQEQRNQQLQRDNDQLLEELAATEHKLRQLELDKEKIIRNTQTQLAIVREQQEKALADVEAMEKELVAQRQLNQKLLAVLAKLSHFFQSLPIGFREVAQKLLEPVRLHLQTLNRPER